MPDKKEKMIRDIQLHAEECSHYTGIKRFSEKVLNAMRYVDRDMFIPVESREAAYEDYAMSIGWGQTISQPFIVALMCELLQLQESDRVLEIGTGCGYHAAVLSCLSLEVYSLEVVPQLHVMALKNLTKYTNVHLSNRNGKSGWKEHAPYDAISVAATAREVPAELADQLSPGGRMVIPLGVTGGPQSLTVVRKSKNGILSSMAVLPVAFVPFVS